MPIAFIRPVSASIVNCELTHLAREPIDIQVARWQHEQYAARLVAHGCSVFSLPSADDLPDAVFIEDIAVVLDEIAVITQPGAVTRRAEIDGVMDALGKFRQLACITLPGTLDGGDVLKVGQTLYVGLSQRTNAPGIRLLASILAPFGYSVQGVPVQGCLHLKSAVTQVAENALLINREWLDWQIFKKSQLIDVHPNESNGANALLLPDGAVIYPSAFSENRSSLEQLGIRVDVVDVSELAKAEGGVTCCSLVFKEMFSELQPGKLNQR